MKNLLAMLMYVTGFVQGQFTQALKQVFNVESMKFIDVIDGVSFLRLDKLLSHLQLTFGKDIQEMYMMLMFNNIIKQGKLFDFFTNGHHGKLNGSYYSNLVLITNFINGTLIAGKLKFIKPEYVNAIFQFSKLIQNIGERKYKLVEVDCLHCNQGMLDQYQKCNVCNGTGVVEQWVYEKSEITDSSIKKLEIELQKYAPIVAEIVEDYIQYYVTKHIYNNHFYINTDRTSNDTFHYNGGLFTVPFYCDLKGAGKFPDKNIQVGYTYNGIEFSIPLLVMRDSLVEKQNSRFHAAYDGENITFPKATIGNENTPTSKYLYVKQNGKKVQGYGELPKSWNKYYVCSYNELTVYFKHMEYTRDEVRQAFAHMANVNKSRIAVSTVTR